MPAHKDALTDSPCALQGRHAAEMAEVHQKAASAQDELKEQLVEAALVDNAKANRRMKRRLVSFDS